MSQTEEYKATGRRKSAIACVRLRPGTGKFVFNGRDIKDYFRTESLQHYLRQPLQVTNTEHKFDIIAKVTGGGPSGQAGAVRHGIARALVLANASLREVLKNSGFLTRDSRIKERKKPGRPGARKRFQFSKR